MIQRTKSILEAWEPFRHHAVQRALWQCAARFVAVPAGRGGGKTELSKRRLVRFLPIKKDWANPRYFYGAPTQAQAKRIAWQDLLNLIPKSWIDSISLGELKIKTVFGSELNVIGMDAPQRIEGVQWDGCVIDESCDIKPKVFELNILPALSWRDGWCWRIGVPKRQGVGAVEFKKFYDMACNGEVADAMGFTWPSSDIIPAVRLEWAQKNLDPKDYREQFDAKFVTAGGGIFYTFERDYNVRPCAYHDDRMIIVGSDFNVDPMAWVLGHKYEDHIEWFDELWLRNTNTEYSLDVLAGRYNTHKGGWEFYGDATGKARKTSASKSDYQLIMNDERFKAMGRTIHYTRSNPLVTDRFAACNNRIKNAKGERRLFVDPRCKHLIDDLEARHYKQGSKEPEDVGDVGHITDAMGYPIHYIWPVMVPIEGAAQTISMTRNT